jgi:hypothetical protein
MYYLPAPSQCLKHRRLPYLGELVSKLAAVTGGQMAYSQPSFPQTCVTAHTMQRMMKTRALSLPLPPCVAPNNRAHAVYIDVIDTTQTQTPALESPKLRPQANLQTPCAK